MRTVIREREDSERKLRVALSGIRNMGSGKIEQNTDEKTLKEIKKILESRMGVWAKIKARIGFSRTGNILKTVDSKVRQLNGKTYKQKVRKTQDGINESKKINENRDKPGVGF